MRILQNIGAYSLFRKSLAKKYPSFSDYRTYLSAYLDSRYGAPHILEPIYSHSTNAVLTVGNDSKLQQLWAEENGRFKKQNRQTTLLEQIEDFKPDFFYNLDPLNYSSDLPKRLPSCVKGSLTWIAAPNKSFDFSNYDIVLTNFPHIQNLMSVKPKAIE